MALPLYKTLGELRLELARRLGYRADPDSADRDWVVDLLIRAQEDLFEELDGWNREILDVDLPTAQGVFKYDWPPSIDPDRIAYIYVERDPNDVIALVEGFDVSEYDLRGAYRSWPLRYQRRAQLEVWPTPDEVYRMIIGAHRRLAPFAQDADRCTVPDDMVFKQAVVYGREDQGRPVSSFISRALVNRVSQIKARSHVQGALLPGRKGVPWPRPRIADPLR